MSRLLLATLLILLSACSSNDDGPTGGAGLAVSIAGLPAGVDADVTVAGPGFNRTLTASETFADVPPGMYSVTARNALNGSAIFAPRAAMQSVVVAAGGVTQAVVTYDPAGTLRLGLQQFVTTGLAAPLFMTAPADDARLFVAERAGRLRIIRNGALLPTPVLDISLRVSTAGEGGFLSFAFDPLFAANGFLYVHFTDPTGDVAVERFQISAGNPDVADPASALRIITITHRTFINHKGGRIAFGPDGFLYLSVGDGGGGGDPSGNGQNQDTLLGKLLRLDVANASAAQPYAIPPSNPFVGQASRRPEIWAYGLRNPWRYAFDAAAGLLYIADVGQAQREEVDVAPASAAALNYGWNLMEGTLCFAVTPCAPQGLTAPVLDYDHGAGCSIIGGFVYRGSAIPELRGRYFYSDLCSGWLRSLRYSGGQAAEQVDWSITNVGQIVSFGEDADHELYMLTAGNALYRIVRQ